MIREAPAPAYEDDAAPFADLELLRRLVAVGRQRPGSSSSARRPARRAARAPGCALPGGDPEPRARRPPPESHVRSSGEWVGRLVRRGAEGTPKDLCAGRDRSGPDPALLAAACRPARRNAPGRWAISVAEADGNRTRRRAFARPPILKDRNVVPYGRGAIGEAR